jgi:flagellar assembly protein FliH
MPSSSRVTPRARLGPASPFRLDALAAGLGGPGGEGDAQRIEKARREGFRAGEAAGRDAEARDRSHLAALAEAHERELGRLNEDLARAVLALAVDLARHVVRAHVDVHEDAVLPVVREALERLREDASPVRVFLSPGDIDRAEGEFGAELARRGCRLVADAALARGECRLESAQAEIDALHGTRWRNAIAPLGATRDWID